MPRFYGTIMRPSANKAVAPVVETKAPPKAPPAIPPKDPKKDGKETGGQ